MKLDWLPDWRDAKAYPKPKDLSWREWAWQFLRRNPEYQSDYESWRALLDTLPADCDQLPSDDMRFWVCDPPAKAGETYKEYANRVGGRWRRTFRAKALPEKYGFGFGGVRLAGEHRWSGLGLVPPEQERFPSTFFTDDIFRFLDHIPGVPKDSYKVEIGEFEILVRFNLEWPIDIQLKRAKKWLENHKSYLKKDSGLEPIENRNQINKFPYYIILLDADASGADPKTMAAVLLSGQEDEHPDYRASKNIRYGLKRARRLRDRDYRFISLGTRTK